MAGDSLARGARSATFGPAKVSQERWDAIWAEEPETKETPASGDSIGKQLLEQLGEK